MIRTQLRAGKWIIGRKCAYLTLALVSPNSKDTNRSLVDIYYVIENLIKKVDINI